MQNDDVCSILTTVYVLLILALSPPVLGADTATMSVFVHEEGSDAPLACRVWVDAGSERHFRPVAQSCTPYARDRSFSCEGRFTIAVPAGRAVVHVERGKEYRPIDRDVVVSKDHTTEMNVTLERWVNMAEEGWYSADLHCHFGVHDLRVLKQLALADDVNFEPILTLWNHQRDGLSDKAWPDWPDGSSVYADPTHLVTLRNQEIERIGGEPFESVGALLMFGLAGPVKMPARNSRYPCDAMLGRWAKQVSPECVIDTDKPIWGENVVGVALGLFDCVQVCHNHYHRDATLPLGWGMTAAEDEEKRADWGNDELFHRTNLTYYRFLNCGFKLAATGGSAMGVMPVPLGYSRTYARLDGPLTEANYLQAIRAGRTFATSGPMLTLTADGKDCGAEIRFSTSHGKSIHVEAHLRSIQPIDRLDVICNGEITKALELKGRRFSSLLEESITMEYTPRRSGWVAARAMFTAPDGRLRQAHTSPIYITVDGKPTAFREDAEYMIRWIDRLAEVAQKPDRYQGDIQRSKVLAVFEQARGVYEAVARRAAETRDQDG